MLGRAEVPQARMRLSSQAFEKHGGEPRLADAGLTGKQSDLAFARLGQGPAPQQQLDFFRPPDKGYLVVRMQRLEVAFRGIGPQRRPGSRRLGDALEVLKPEIRQFE